MVLRLILGDQLNHNHSWFQEKNNNILYVMMEMRQETDYVKHHIQKVIGFFSAMRLFAQNLENQGHQIIYLRLDDKQNRQSLIQNLAWLIEQNKVAILKDLEADAVTIDSILVTEQASINTFDRFMNLLYLSKNKSINESQLMDSIKSIPDIIATTFTLYVNNSSFKNMQSSGLLSYVDEEELKTSLSYYYEVVFKRIESNNSFFDQVGTELNGILPIGIGTLIRKVRTDSTSYDLNKPSNYLNFMLSLNETKNLLQSEKFIYDLQRYYNQIFVYQLALKLAKAENHKLIQLLKSEHK